MNVATSAVTPAATVGTVKIGHAVIVGRLHQIRRIGKLYEHLVVVPAPDPYSSPATVPVLCELRLGEVGADIRVTVRVAGYRRSYKSTDQETGEQRTVMTADAKLYVIE